MLLLILVELLGFEFLSRLLFCFFISLFLLSELFLESPLLSVLKELERFVLYKGIKDLILIAKEAAQLASICYKKHPYLISDFKFVSLSPSSRCCLWRWWRLEDPDSRSTGGHLTMMTMSLLTTSGASGVSPVWWSAVTAGHRAVRGDGQQTPGPPPPRHWGLGTDHTGGWRWSYPGWRCCK